MTDSDRLVVDGKDVVLGGEKEPARSLIVEWLRFTLASKCRVEVACELAESETKESRLRGLLVEKEMGADVHKTYEEISVFVPVKGQSAVDAVGGGERCCIDDPLCDTIATNLI